ncbi:MAG TPA: ferredoxin [Acidimicrobiales bacterium]|nr:ferredoxin [Acidimicrobiales bacterium]
MSAGRLRVDPIACAGHGICAELLPEMITLDDWGYPMIDDRPVPDELLAHARRAVTACPAIALRLDRLATGGAAPVGRPPGRRPA